MESCFLHPCTSAAAIAMRRIVRGVGKPTQSVHCAILLHVDGVSFVNIRAINLTSFKSVARAVSHNLKHSLRLSK